MLPGVEAGRSSCAIRFFASVSRAWLGARTISVLVRGSASTEIRWPASIAWPAARAPSSSTRLTTVAISIASPYFTGIISRSEVAGVSIDSMMRWMRRRFSA